MRKALILFTALTFAAPATAQLRLPYIASRRPLPPPQQQVVQPPIDAARADFAAQAGGTTVYFMSGSAELGQQARTTLSGQAAWLRFHPDVAVRIEGHGDSNDTRDHALALGASRAQRARDYLILLGVPAAQVGAMTWGKERPGAPRAVTVIVASSGGAALVPASR